MTLICSHQSLGFPVQLDTTFYHVECRAHILHGALLKSIGMLKHKPAQLVVVMMPMD